MSCGIVKNKNSVFRQGDTTTIMLELSHPLGEMKLKMGIYTTNGRALYETYYPDDGVIQMVDETHFVAVLHYDITRHFMGSTSLRLCVFKDDKLFVNAGETALLLNWAAEPVNKNIR